MTAPKASGSIDGVTLPMWAVRVMTFVSVAAVPWAVTVQVQLASLQVEMRSISDRELPPAWLKEQVKENSQRIRHLEVKK